MAKELLQTSREQKDNKKINIALYKIRNRIIWIRFSYLYIRYYFSLQFSSVLNSNCLHDAAASGLRKPVIGTSVVSPSTVQLHTKSLLHDVKPMINNVMANNMIFFIKYQSQDFVIQFHNLHLYCRRFYQHRFLYLPALFLYMHPGYIRMNTLFGKTPVKKRL